MDQISETALFYITIQRCFNFGAVSLTASPTNVFQIIILTIKAIVAVMEEDRSQNLM